MRAARRRVDHPVRSLAVGGLSPLRTAPARSGRSRPGRADARRAVRAAREVAGATQHLKDLILPYVYAEARALLSDHRGAGQDVIIVSTSGQEVVAPIGALLGAESVIATRMRIANGHYTGEMECYAYSDSVTDLPLLEIVGHPRAVNPDRALRRIATVRGWPVLSFSSVCERPPGSRRGEWKRRDQ